MTQPKSILVLTSDAGFGHRSAALAIQSALEDIYGADCKIHLLNPLEDKRTPKFLRDSQSDYDRIIKEAPDLYRIGFEASDNPFPSAVVDTMLIVLLFEVMRELMEKFKPDAIVTTYPLYQSALEAAITFEQKFIPVYTVVTDLSTVHRLWFYPSVSACLVPNSFVKDLAIENKLKPAQVIETGIPVSPRIYKENRTPTAIRRELGWDEKRLTVLAVGSKRVERLLETVNTFNHSGYPVQLAIAAGKDAVLYEKLQAVEWHVPTFLYEYTDNMPLLMHASDAIICKAGGLIVTESLACELPILLVDVLPGQEAGNAEYILNGGAGDIAKNPLQVLETLCHWMANDRSLLKTRANNSRRLGKPFAAREIAEIVWQGACLDEAGRKKQFDASRPGIVKLFAPDNTPFIERLKEVRQRLDKGNLFTPHPKMIPGLQNEAPKK